MIDLSTFPSDFMPAAVVIAVTGFVAGLARGMSGFGAAMIFVPFASAVLTPVVAAPVLLITDAVATGGMIAHGLKRCDWGEVGWAMAGALVGLPVGIWILTGSDPMTVRWIVSIAILASLSVMAAGWQYRGPRTRPVVTGVGAFSGVLSGLAQIGGPPMVLYWISSNDEVARIRANLIAFFAVIMATSLLTFAFKGLVTARVLWFAAAAVPGYALGTWLGSLLFPLASAVTYRRIAMGLVALSALVSLPILDRWLGFLGR